MNPVDEQTPQNLDTQPTEKPAPRKKNCRYYLRGGGCSYGDRCHFAHVENVGQQNQQRKNKPRYRKGPSTKTGKNTQESAVNETQSSSVVDDRNVDEYKEKLDKLSDKTPVDKPTEQDVVIETNAEGIPIKDDQKSSSSKVLYKNDEKTLKSNDKKKTTKKPPRTCRYFSRKGGCRNGDSCPFSHVQNAREIKRTMVRKTQNEQRVDYKDKENEKPQQFGASLEGTGVQNKTVTNQGVSNEKSDKKESVVKPLGNRSLAKALHEMTDEDVHKLRTTEIDQLKKRFQTDNRLKIVKENAAECVYCITVVPSDPDWSYDIQQLELDISFPKDYPRQIFHASLSVEQYLPKDFTRIMNSSLSNWLKQQDEMRNKKKTVELLFRPFLRWLDRNFELLFTHALKQMKRDIEAKAAGIEFVPFEALPGANDSPTVETSQNNSKSGSEYLSETSTAASKGDQKHSEENKPTENEDKQVKNSESTETGSSYQEDPTSDKSETSGSQIGSISSEKKGTEIKLKGLKMAENVATLRAVSVLVTVECDRCKNREDARVSEKNPVGVQCSRCSTVLKVKFRPDLVHQLSSTLGFLDLANCHAFDLILVECSLMIGCLNCSKECSLEGLHYGGSHHMWCLHCHQKMSIQIESTRFQLLQPATQAGDSGMVLVSSKKTKVAKDPGIKEGYPLPDLGVCKHYKKSHRWLRFPCCGKTYPCDKCHDTEEDHELIFANRMVCGYCSKEQPFSQKQCVSCNSSTTKAITSHWEGGKGCRDRVKMNRGDNKKYKNVSKTVSRKVSEPTKKEKKK